MSLAVKSARAQFAGDPGLFGTIGKFLGGAVRTVARIAPGPVGFGLGLLGGVLPGGRPQPVAVAPTNGRFRGGARMPLFGAGTQPRVGPPISQAAAGVAPGVGLACPKGMTPNKSDYFLKTGQFVPAGTKCVSIRRRNPLNPRAADRAISRLESAKKAVTRLNRITIRSKCPK